MNMNSRMAMMTVLTWMALSVGATAGTITYNVVDYPSLQNGISVQGTITTDGAIGTLSVNDLVSWNITLAIHSLTVNFNPNNSAVLFSDKFIATPTKITVDDTTDFNAVLFFESDSPGAGAIQWVQTSATTGQYIGNDGSNPNFWNSAWNLTDPVAVAVPEPSTTALAVLGAGCFFAGGLVRKRRG